MPQTGPRPVYSAPVPPPSANIAPPASAGPQAGGSPRSRRDSTRPAHLPKKPSEWPRWIARLWPASAGGQPYTPGAAGAPGRRPMHPTRSSPAGGPPGSRPPMGGGRPGFRRVPALVRVPVGRGTGGLVPPPGEAPRPQRPSGPPRGRGGNRRYERGKKAR